MTPQKLRDKQEKKALKVFANVYRQMWLRTRKALDENALQDLIEVIGWVYQLEPAKLQAPVKKLYMDMAYEVANETAIEVGRDIQRERLVRVISQLADEASRTFAAQVSEHRRQLLYEVIQDTITTPGADKGEMIRRLKRDFDFLRPDVAATTETTKLVARTRVEAFKEMGITEFQPITRNDSRVRPEHARYASEGPYPIDRADRYPPYGDFNCRCTIVAAGL